MTPHRTHAEVSPVKRESVFKRVWRAVFNDPSNSLSSSSVAKRRSLMGEIPPEPTGPQGRGSRMGLLEAYQQNGMDGQGPMSPHDELLLRYAIQPALRAPIDKVAKIVGTCRATICLRKGAREQRSTRNYLESLISSLYAEASQNAASQVGAPSFEVQLLETIVRLKVTGECFWEWVWPDKQALEAQRPVAVRRAMGEIIRTEREQQGEVGAERIKSLGGAVFKAVNQRIDEQIARPIGLRVMQGTVNPIFDKYGRFIDPQRAYVQVVASGERAYFAQRDLLWMRGPNPLGGAHALAPFETLRFLDDVDEKVQVYTNAVLDNRGQVGGVVTVKNPGVGELDRIREDLGSQHTGPENAGKWYVVGVDETGDTKVDAFAMKPIEIEHPDAHQRRLNLFWALINVPGAKVGFTQDVNKANSEMQDKALIEEEIMPLCRLIAAPFNAFLRSIGITDYYLSFSEADLRTESSKLEQLQSKIKLGQLTVNEMLQSALGNDTKVQDGDVRFIDLDSGVLIFSPNKPAHIMTKSGVVVPLFPDPNAPAVQPQGAGAVAPGAPGSGVKPATEGPPSKSNGNSNKTTAKS